MTGIKRLPDGTYILKIDLEEIGAIKMKIEKDMELDEREETIAREFELI